MAQERPSTPEKQLLNLIESRNGAGPESKVQTAKHKGMSFVSPGAWRGRFSFFRDNLRRQMSKGTGANVLDIRVINNTLIVCVLLLSFYLLTDIYFSFTGLKRMPGLRTPSQEGSKQLPDIRGISLLKQSASYYIGSMENRDIFKMRGKKTQESQEPIYKAPTSRITEAVAHLKLVGISWSNDPDAMVEDTQSMKTFFVKRGSMIGPIKVQAIFKDKLVLGIEGEEAELR